MRWLLLIWLGLLPPCAAALEPPAAAPAVGELVVHMLEEAHYNHHPISESESRLFLRNYIESYDYSHMVFTQADVEGFEREYGASLADRVRAGDVEPAYAIFDRFVARLKERNALLHELTADTFTFTADESLSTDWSKAPWPANDREVRDVWRRNVKYELLRARLDGQKSSEQVKTINSHYDNLLESYKEFDAGDVLQDFLAALCRVFDPHSDYLAASKEENFNISMRLALVGIGAALRSEAGYTRVVSLIPGGPADVDKRLRPGDKIEAVAQGDADFVDVVGMKIDRVVALIRGTKGTVVRLRLIPADAIDPSTRVVISLVRDEIHLKDQEAKAKLVTTHPKGGQARRFGVIQLPSFYTDMQGKGKSTTQDVEALLGTLSRKGIEGLVLDLRGNGGGALNEAVSLTGAFIGRGPVVQVKDSRGEVSVLESKKDPLYGGPLIVLTSRASASASEILAAALQDYGRAVIVGPKSTFGKGTVQSVMTLDQYIPPSLRPFKAGAVHLTVQKFYRISGGSTQNRGVVPDVKLPSVEDEMDIAESSLPNALPYDEIRPAEFQAFYPSVRRFLSSTKAASAARVAASPEFSYVREDMETYRRRLADKTVSLKESKLLAEKKADEERDARRKKERLARGVLKEDELEITLDALDGVKPSTAAAQASGRSRAAAVERLARSSSPAEGAEDYEKAPPAPDLMLEESLNVLTDMSGGPKALAQEGAPARGRDSEREPEPALAH